MATGIAAQVEGALSHRIVISDVDQLDADVLEADVCVVGAGAAGLTIASELDGCGARVLVLESGRRSYERRTQGLYDADVVGLPHEGVHDLRFRIFGGSTTHWAGQVLPLLPVDFSDRDWVAESGWPLDEAELAPYYLRASRSMGIEPFPAESDDDAWPKCLPAPPRFDPGLVRSRFSKFCPVPNFAELLGAGIERSTNVEVLLGANVTELVAEPALGALDALTAVSLSGRRVEVRAANYVLCLGGLETTRLMLVSDRRCEGGIGNRNDVLGRYFQDHPGIEIGTIEPRSRKELRNQFGPHREGSIKHFPVFSLADALQREERLLQSMASVQFGGEVPSILAAKTLLRSLGRSDHSAKARSEAPAALRDLVRDPAPPLRAAYQHFVLRRPAFDSARRPPTLTTGGEQAPNPDSRVTLSDRRDELGLRRLALDWRVTEQDLRSWRRFAELMAMELERLELGSVRLDLGRLPEDPGRVSGLVDAGHHMGTTRMSADPSKGVVDPDCRVHGVENLFIASSSVFPTSGCSNPTYTILALAIRVADSLREHHAPRAQRSIANR